MSFFKNIKLISTPSAIILSLFLLYNLNSIEVYGSTLSDNSDSVTKEYNSYVDLDSLILEMTKSKNKTKIDKEDFIKIKNTAYDLYNNIDINKDSVTQAKLNHIIGTCYFYLFDYEKSYNYLSISSQNFSDEINYTIQIDNYYLLSKINLNNGKKIESMDFFNKSIELAILKKDYVLASNLYIIRASDLSRDKNNIDDVKLNINNALKLVDDNKTANQAQIYYDAGTLYSNNLDKLLLGNQLFANSQKIFEANKNTIGEINCRVKIAKNYLLFNENEQVISILSPLLSNESYKLDVNEFTYIIVNLYLLEAYISVSDYDNANLILNNIEDSLSDYNGIQKIDALILTHIHKANLYCNKNNRDKSINEINKAFDLYNKNLESISMSNLNIILEGTLGDIYFKFNNVNKALEHHTKALELSKHNADSINMMSYTKKLALDNEYLGNYKNSSMLFKDFNELFEKFIASNNAPLLYSFNYELNDESISPHSIYDNSEDNKKINDVDVINVILTSLLSISTLSALYILYNLVKRKNDSKDSSKLNEFIDLYNMDYLNNYLLEKWDALMLTKTNISLISLHIEINNISEDNSHIFENIIHNLKNKCLRNSDLIILNNNNSSIRKSNFQSYEFLMPLLNTNKDNSIEIAKRINESISYINDEYSDTTQINMYIGISTLTPSASIDYTSLIHRSYAGLYYSINSETLINHIDDVVEII